MAVVKINSSTDLCVCLYVSALYGILYALLSGFHRAVNARSFQTSAPAAMSFDFQKFADAVTSNEARYIMNF